MATSSADKMEITPQTLLKAYACGIFPMAESADDPEIFWVEPKLRGILPLDDFHVSRSLKKTVRKTSFEIRYNTTFNEVVSACGEFTETRPSTWINPYIKQLYSQLHDIGHAHSVEIFDGEDLVGGLYGVSLGGAFFGESMFSRRTDASKIALVHLVAHLRNSGFSLLDTQFVTEHLLRFGAIEINREQYHQLLDEALLLKCNFLDGIDRNTGTAVEMIDLSQF